MKLTLCHTWSIEKFPFYHRVQHDPLGWLECIESAPFGPPSSRFKFSIQLYPHGLESSNADRTIQEEEGDQIALVLRLKPNEVDPVEEQPKIKMAKFGILPICHLEQLCTIKGKRII